MDLEPELRQAVLRIRDALHQFANSKGWTPDDYRIFMKFNVSWGNFIVSLLAKAFDPHWSKTNAVYDQLLDHLESALRDDPGLYDSINLMIYQYQDHAYSIVSEPFDGYIDIDERLLNPDVEETRPVASGLQREMD